MKLIDTNILIYSGEAVYAPLLLPLVTDTNNNVSAISHIETLGFHKITPEQIAYFEHVFQILQTIPIDAAIVQRAVAIRQVRRISLGDSIIAATALVHNLEIITRNVADFVGIAGIKVTDPLSQLT